MEVNRRGRTFLITGGGGYFGFRCELMDWSGVDYCDVFISCLDSPSDGTHSLQSNLACALLKTSSNVVLFDVRPPSQELPEGIVFMRADIRDYTQVEEAVRGVNCAFHIASYGMSGQEQLNRKLIEEVNVQGTENILRACVAHRVPRLVYASTYNVVFGGQEIKDGDESLPYLPLHPDHYPRTKSIAEMQVLKANGSPLNNSVGVLQTCALRPAGIQWVRKVFRPP